MTTPATHSVDEAEALRREAALALVTVERAEHHLPPCKFDMLTEEAQQQYLHRADAVMPILLACGNERAAAFHEAGRRAGIEEAAKVAEDDGALDEHGTRIVGLCEGMDTMVGRRIATAIRTLANPAALLRARAKGAA